MQAPDLPDGASGRGPAPFVSVIVPTYKREEVLCRTLLLLFSQDYPIYEIIVVDQTAKHSEATERFLGRHRNRLRYIRLKRPSLTRARNAGILAARGEILLFLDDDIVPTKHLIRAHVEAFEEGVGAVAGQVLPPHANSAGTTQVGAIVDRAEVVANFNSTVAGDVLHAPGGNTSVLRRAALEVGLFEPAFGGTALREETDFYLRLRRLGYRIKFEPEASLRHLALTSGGCGNRRTDMQWYYWLAHNNLLLGMRHPELFSIPRVVRRQLPALARKKGPLLVLPWLLAHLTAPVSHLRARRSLQRARHKTRQPF